MRKRLGLVMCVLALSAFGFGCGGGETVSVGSGSEKPGNGDKPGKEDGNKPGNNNENPGNNGDKPGNNGDKPGNNNEDPGNNNEDPGNNNEDPSIEVCQNKPDADGDTISDEDEGKDENRDSDDDGIPDYLDLDSDGDTVPDKLEAMNDGCSGNMPGDALGIGIPNYLNDDSDGNGILDGEECCGKDEDCLAAVDSDGLFTYCIDSDGNKIPDFLDEDNDGDGIDDLVEIEGGNDGLNSAISINSFYGDCDGDGQPDAKGSAASPIDCDSDTIPDYMDDDSDGDGLPDSVEMEAIVGGYYARYSKDSDGNGISDYAECAGVSSDDEVTAVPEKCVDTDDDTIPDFLDVDNDGDGLSDTFEQGIGSDPFNDDTDGDGANDLIEYGAGTSLTDAEDNPQSKGNFVFVVPYQKPSSPDKGSLSFSTSVQVVDVYFAIDTSGSTTDEYNALKANITPLLDSLQCKVKDSNFVCKEDKDCADQGIVDSICSVTSNRCVEDPTKKSGGCVTDMWTGVGTWCGCNYFHSLQNINPDLKATVAALGNYYYPGGSYENAWDAVYCSLATEAETGEGKVCKSRSASSQPCSSGDTCIGFRENAIRTLVVLTDEGSVQDNICPAVSDGDYDYNYTPSLSEHDRQLAIKTGEYARSKRVNVIGFWGTATSQPAAINVLTPVIEGNGLDTKDFLIKCDGAGIVEATKKAIISISQNKPLAITTDASDIDEGAASLIDGLTVNIVDTEIEGKTCTKVENIVGGKFEGIAALLPGRAVCYDVKPVAVNNVIPAQNVPLVKKAKIAVKGDGSTLSERIVYFLIPPVLEQESGIN